MTDVVSDASGAPIDLWKDIWRCWCVEDAVIVDALRCRCRRGVARNPKCPTQESETRLGFGATSFDELQREQRRRSPLEGVKGGRWRSDVLEKVSEELGGVRAFGES